MVSSHYDEYMIKAKELDGVRERGDEKGEDELVHVLEHLWWKLTDEEQDLVVQERLPKMKGTS